MIDWGRLRQLCAEVGEEEFAPLLELFLDEIEESIVRSTATGRRHLEVHLHRLHACAVSAGLVDVALLCKQFEECLHRGRPEDVNLGLIGATYTASKRALIAGLPGLAGQSGAA